MFQYIYYHIQYYRLALTALFLSAYPNLLNDLAYLWLKSHVKHPVCLIQNKVSAALQVRCSSLQKVNQAAWCGNAYLNTSLQISCLYKKKDVKSTSLHHL